MNTFAGSNFMTAFNAWYYSFSPAVAQYELRTPAARSIARAILYPLMGILGLSELTFVAFGSASELGALTAGLLAGVLIGLTYLALPALCILWPLRRRISADAKRRTLKTLIFMFTLLLAGFTLSEMLALSAMMIVSSVGLALAALTTGSILPTILASQLKRAVKAR
jgi:hypothetical protein